MAKRDSMAHTGPLSRSLKVLLSTVEGFASVPGGQYNERKGRRESKKRLRRSRIKRSCSTNSS